MTSIFNMSGCFLYSFDLNISGYRNRVQTLQYSIFRLNIKLMRKEDKTKYRIIKIEDGFKELPKIL